MSSAVRIGDNCTGHQGYKPRPALTGSNNVKINGSSAVRVGDNWDIHCFVTCHNGTSVAGSSSVFVNGQPAVRIGDHISCGSNAAVGSPNVNIGG
jgi:uncharacterized Zn-binding protein involved in type VI secretion